MAPARTKKELEHAASAAERFASRLRMHGMVIRSAGEREQIAQCLETLADAGRRALEGPLATMRED